MATGDETTFLSCLRILRTLSKLIGLENIEINTSTNNENLGFNVKRSFKATFYTVSIILALTGSNFFFSYVWINQQDQLAPLSRATWVVNSNCIYLTSLAGLIGMSLNGNTRVEIMKLFVKVDDILLDFSRNSYSSWSRYCTFGNLTILSFIIFSDILSFLNLNNSFEFVYKSIYFMIMDFIIFLSLSNYVVIILHTRQRLAILNDKLRNHNNLFITRNCRTWKLSPNVEETPGQIQSPLMTITTDLFGPEVTLEDCQDTKAKLFSSLNLVYSMIYKITSLTNAAYGVQVLLIVMCSFTNVMHCLYFWLSKASLQYVYGEFSSSPVMQASTLCWFLMYASDMVALACSCSLVTREAGITKDLVQDLLLEPDASQDSRELLSAFARQTAHRDVRFSCAGFFPLGLPLLTAVAGSMASYVVVLLQMESPQCP